MILRHIAARTAALRSPIGALLPPPSGWQAQSSRHASSASAVLEAAEEAPHHERTKPREAPRIKMPAGRGRPPLEACGPPAGSSSSASSARRRIPQPRENAFGLLDTASETGSADHSSPPRKKTPRSPSTSRQPARPARPVRRTPRDPSSPPLTTPERREEQQGALAGALAGAAKVRAGRFIQAALSVPVREPKLYARQLLEQLEADRALLNAHSALALERYALRLNMRKVANRVRNLALSERLALPPRPASHQFRLKGKTTNAWMMKKFPPLALLPEDRVTSERFLRHQHYLLIHGEGHSLTNAVGTLRALKAGGGPRLAALHLALCYAPAPGSVLDEAAELGFTYYPRGTVHAAVLSLLKCRTRVADVEALLARFAVRPSPETFCVVAEHAIEYHDRDLAEYAWAQGKLALAHERRLAKVPQQWGDDPFTNARGKTIFRHLGRRLSRWERAMHRIRDLGWATRTYFMSPLPEGLPTLAARWEWLPREGEAETEAEVAKPRKATAAAQRTAGSSGKASGKTSPGPANRKEAEHGKQA